MNRRQRNLLTLIGCALALVLIVLLVLNFTQRPDTQTALQDPPTLTVPPTAEPTQEPLTEEELGKQALSEEDESHEEGGEPLSVD